MPEALHVTASVPTIWDGDRIATALALAERQASRCARARALGRADREDLRQEILLAVVERAHRFDAAIAPWAAFVTLLARHAVADWRRAEQQRQSVATLSLEEVVDGDAVVDAPAVDDGADLRTALDAFLLDAPPSACTVLLLIAAACGDVAAAQRVSGLPPSSFYRALAALRFWLHAAGLRTASRWLGKNARVDRQRKVGAQRGDRPMRSDPTLALPGCEIARELVSTVNALCDRLGNTPVGTTLTYHIGHLACDRTPTMTKLDPAACAELDLLADRAMQLAEQGWVHLVQRRVAPECFAYQVVIRPRRPYRAAVTARRLAA